MTTKKILTAILKQGRTKEGKKITKTNLAREIGIARQTLHTWIDGTHEVRGVLYKQKIEALANKYKIK